MQKSVMGKREEASGLYCGPCAEVSFNVKRKVFVDLGEICVGCLSRVVESNMVNNAGEHDWDWRPATNLERMAAAVGKTGGNRAKQRRCKCRGPRRLCKCAK